jgi:hypothetical protein
MLGRTLAALLERAGFLPRSEFKVRWTADMPSRDELAPGVLVIVGERRSPKWVTMPCPSNCGTPLLLSLSQSRRPKWSVSTDWLGRPTLSPSVRRTDGCRCHFWLRKGIVAWCADTGRN